MISLAAAATASDRILPGLYYKYYTMEQIYPTRTAIAYNSRGVYGQMDIALFDCYCHLL